MLTDTRYCKAYYDSFLCWGPTPGGHTTFQKCPNVRLSDPTQLAFRTCHMSGQWLGRRLNETSAAGWTNYTPCFPIDVKLLFDKVSEDENSQLKFEIARNTRILEIVGFSISLVALLVSLFLFSHFRLVFTYNLFILKPVALFNSRWCLAKLLW
ncbi:unnamed protein product [Chilo suppressalis]|uniref:G-protein coupled receptors family 2 profile 1 domain-containing protein n=1 Tax=Chilo suppressalis TaxID=168631 RepID=A0ABN8ECX1_CHISP|nr:unnamed protein product [Chilo suppressalis]